MQSVEKMACQSPSGYDLNMDKLAQVLPGCIIETTDEEGNLKRAIDFNKLQTLVGDQNLITRGG